MASLTKSRKVRTWDILPLFFQDTRPSLVVHVLPSCGHWSGGEGEGEGEGARPDLGRESAFSEP